MWRSRRLGLEVVEERPGDLEPLYSELQAHRGPVTVGVVEQVAYVIRARRRTEGDHRTHRAQPLSGQQARGTAQAVTAESAGPVAALDQRTRRSGEITHVVGKGRGGELARALTQPGEVEPEHGVARLGQARGQASHGVEVLGAREAMRQQDAATHSILGHMEPADQACAGTASELNIAHRHASTVMLGVKVT